MTATLEPCSADEVYSRHLEPRVRGRVHRAVDVVLDLWCATTGGTFELTSTGDVVVRRRHDGTEELRVFGGTPQAAAPLLDQLDEDLATLSPDHFRVVWGLDPTG
ncbi:hypothetical protein H5V45_00180 [Nocardioides sp. KIGAM211]|uniref:DUF2218 domain-containing protein n=1 Tax=Nocardioides luti TaxID=2761101 RepID=A0A7X0V9A2_9ACTN|nr:hypothetical protein [Nocardioides luti]MBB6625722.1 hypothetical protein [Nocardioides luti]